MSDTSDDGLLSELAALTDTQLDAVLDGLPPDAVQAILDAVPAKADGRTLTDVLESYSIKLQPKQALAQKLVDDADELLYGGAAGGGKALAVDTPIPTPNGWTTMGDLTVGDTVFDENGAPTLVEWVSPVYTDHDCYRVAFDDGSEIVADAGHLWTVHPSDGTTIAAWTTETVTTEALSMMTGRDGKPAYAVPMVVTPDRDVYGERLIMSVQPTLTVPVKCIGVNSPSRLFLAGETMIPTHNSFWLLAHAVAQMEMHPGNRGIIFRRVMPSLKRSILPAAVALLHSKAEHNKVDNTFTFPNGSVLEFGHLQHDDSVHTYQGAEYGFIGFEEVTEFLEAQWEFMSSRARAPADGIRPHMVATANPGGVGHRWVKRRWVKPDDTDVAVGSPKPSPNTVWQARPQVEGEPPSRRVFIPARLDDNPALLERDPAYRTRLRAITNRALREAMESGDWDAIDQIEGALWEWDWIRRVSPVDVSDYGSVGGMSRVVVAVDPAASAKPGSDETGIVVCGRGYDGDGYVLADRSCRVSPEQWAARAIQAYHDFSADVIVAERNNGGDMVVSVLKGIDPNVPVRTVWASRGKRTRAEPVAALYEHGRVAHAGTFAELEEQLTTWVPDDGDSPDRLDALVWGITDLLVDTSGGSTVQYRNVSLKGTR